MEGEAKQQLCSNSSGSDSDSSSNNESHGQQLQQQPFPPTVRSSTSAAASALVISACDKAGMEGIDRDRIDAIIMRESDKTMYMQQQRRRDDKVNAKINVMRKRLETHQQQQQQDIINNNNNNNNNHWLRKIETELEPEINDILKTRRLRSTACVVDMDCFYWACELLSKPHLKELPCCVGGSMITTSNYPARKFGVRSGMAGWIADTLVDELTNGQQKLIHVPNQFPLYQEKGKVALEVFRQFDPKCRSYSLDEAYLDLAPYLALKLSHPSWNHEQISRHLTIPANTTKATTTTTTTKAIQSSSNSNTTGAEIQEEENSNSNNVSSSNNNNNNHNKDTQSEDSSVAAEDNNQMDYEAILQKFSSGICLAAASDTVAFLRDQVCQATGGLTCSAGLASSFQIAKICSDIHKPNGQKMVGDDLEQDVFPFLRKLSTRKVPGIGRVSQKILEAFGISTVQQLFDDRAKVRFLFGPATAKFLLRASLGGFGSSSHDIGSSSTTGDDGGDNNTNASTSATSSSIKRKGISKERTFSHSDSWSKIYSRLEDIARGLGTQMNEEGIFARTISLKVKLHTFDIIQRSKTVTNGASPLQKGDDLFSHAIEMLQELRKEHKGTRSPFSPRLIGIRCCNLVDANEVSALVANQGVMAKFLSGPSTAANNTTKPQASVGGPRGYSKSPEPTKRAASNSFFGSQVVDDVQKTPAVALLPNQASRAAVTPDSTATTDSIQQQTAACPICNQIISAASGGDALNRALNNHIDSCLNGQAVRQAVQEETKRCDSRSKPTKKQRLADFFSK